MNTETLSKLIVTWEAAAEARDKDGPEWDALAPALDQVTGTQCPASREDEAADQGPDYIGATEDGDLVVWGRDGGAGWRYIEVI